MPITIPDNSQVRVAHDFDQKPGTAKVAITEAGPLSVSFTGSRPDGTALFEPTDGDNNEGYIGIGLISASVNQGITALRNTIISGFAGVLPGREVFLGQDGSLTQDASGFDAPDTAPVATESVGVGVLAAGVYTIVAAFVDADGGVTLASPEESLTIAANKQIDIADYEQPLPDGVDSVNWYMSVAPGSDTLKFVVNNDGTAFSINVLPDADADEPLTSVAVAGSRRVGIGFTSQMIAFD